MADIFLSYAEEDRAAARRIVGVLELQGWSVWWDRRIPTGKTWRSAIEDGIRDMRCMVVLWSSNSIGSEWVNEEAEEGRAAAKLMPVLIERVRPPLGLRSIQATDLIDWDGSEDAAAVRQLISDIRAMMQASGPPETQPAPISEDAPAAHKSALPLTAAKSALSSLVWGGALVLAAAATLALVLRQQAVPPADTKPLPPAAAIFIPTPVPTPAPVERAAVTQESSVLKAAPSESAPVVTQEPEPHRAPFADLSFERASNEMLCTLRRGARLDTLDEEEKAFLKRNCQPCSFMQPYPCTVRP